MAWALSGTGSVAAQNAKVSSASYTAGAITASAGETVFVGFHFDNTNSTTPTISSITVPGGETATWVQQGLANTIVTNAGGVRTDVWSIKVTQTWTAFTPVVTLSAAVTAKSSEGRVFTGGAGAPAQRVTAPVSGGASSSSLPSQAVTVGAIGDLIIGAAGFETATVPIADADTTNGSWDAGVTSATTGSTDGTNIVGIMQYKVITATGTQTYNPTNSTSTDSTVVAMGFSPDVPEARVSRVAAKVLIQPSSDARVSRVAAKVLIANDGSVAAVEQQGVVALTAAATLSATAVREQLAAVSLTAASTLGVAGSVTASYSSVVLADSPLGYWRLGEPSGTTMNDSSGNAHNGTYAGGTLGQASTLVGDSDTAWLAPGAGSAFNVMASVPAAAWIDKTSFTAECIIRGTGTAGGMILGRDSSITRVWRWNLATGTMYFTVIAGANPWTDVSNSTVLCDGNPHHIAVTYDGTTAKMYVDGALDKSVALNQALPSNNTCPLSIGNSNRSAGSEPLVGMTVDEVAYYGSVLSGTRIAAHYAATGLTSITKSATAALTAASTLTVAGVRQPQAVASLSATSTLTTAAVREQPATVALTATSVLTASASTGGVLQAAAVALTATSVLVATADRQREVAVSLTAVSTLGVTGSLTPAISYSSLVLADSPLGYWRLGESAKTSPMVDSSGNGHDGTYGNNPVLGAAGLVRNDSDTAMSTVVSVGYGVVPYGSWMNVTNLTLEILARPNSGIHNYCLWDRDNADNGPPVNRTFFLRFYQGSILEFVFWTVSGSYQLTTPISAPGGRTFHVVATYDGTTAKLYLDGVLSNSLTVASPPEQLYHSNTTVPLSIGTLTSNGGHFDPYQGILDEAAFYGTALSAARVLAHSAAGAPIPKAGTSAAVYDYTGSGTGYRAPRGTITRAYSWSGTATGRQNADGTIAGTYDWAGDAAGLTPEILFKSGVSGGHTAWAGTSRGARTRAGTGTGGYRWHGLGLGGVPGPAGELPTLHWTLTDKATGETWTMPTNPNTMTGLPRIKQLTTASFSRQGEARLRTFQAPTTADKFDWSGVILSAQHYQDLLTWSEKSGVIVVTDHLERSFEVIIQAFTPETKAGRHPNDPKRHYTMSTLFLRRLP